MGVKRELMGVPWKDEFLWSKKDGWGIEEELQILHANKTLIPTTERSRKNQLSRPAKDDTKPVLQDPILRSDPIETEEVVLRLPPFPITRSTPASKMT
ncbi:Cell division control protein 48-like C-like [Quillaja saponaria]|uniref:Cell division control protein 48-like C-like n=1 Tax=Quillaja saponaria TaxID=32244 RepID=A0AAD7LQ50_QUISA|nr:Cell division control protein 48-like C-like [Quillaja saponaria]